MHEGNDFEERARPSVRDDDRGGTLMWTTSMQEVRPRTVDLYSEMGKPFEGCAVLLEVEAGGPCLHQVPDEGDRGAGRPVVHGLRRREPGVLESSGELGNRIPVEHRTERFGPRRLSRRQTHDIHGSLRCATNPQKGERGKHVITRASLHSGHLPADVMIKVWTRPCTFKMSISLRGAAGNCWTRDGPGTRAARHGNVPRPADQAHETLSSRRSARKRSAPPARAVRGDPRQSREVAVEPAEAAEVPRVLPGRVTAVCVSSLTSSNR
jgi:hypothetical protein